MIVEFSSFTSFSYLNYPKLYITLYQMCFFLTVPHHLIVADLVMIIMAAMNGESVEELVMQMRSLMAGLDIVLLGDINMGFLVC